MKETIRTVSLVIVLIPAMSSPTASWAQARAKLVQSVDVQVPLPPTPVRVAGKAHLAYELHITNFRPFDIGLTRVEVLSDDEETPLGSFRDSDLTSSTGAYA